MQYLMPNDLIIDELNRLKKEIYCSREREPDDLAALYARQELWLERERLRLVLKGLGDQDAPELTSPGRPRDDLAARPPRHGLDPTPADLIGHPPTSMRTVLEETLGPQPAT